MHKLPYVVTVTVLLQCIIITAYFFPVSSIFIYSNATITITYCNGVVTVYHYNCIFLSLSHVSLYICGIQVAFSYFVY